MALERDTSWHEPFLEALSRSANESKAAEMASVSLKLVWLTKEADPEFAADCRVAQARGVDQIKAMLLRYTLGKEIGSDVSVPVPLRCKALDLYCRTTIPQLGAVGAASGAAIAPPALNLSLDDAPIPPGFFDEFEEPGTGAQKPEIERVERAH